MSDTQPLFILCPLRSYSSVVCGMLGQHPEMYGFPELNLFVGDTLGEVMLDHRDRPNGTHGLLRAIAQLESDAQTEESIQDARRWISQREDWAVRAVFDHLRDAVAPRVSIDKSPRVVMRPEYLDRIYNCYPEASYLHLVRHPRSTCISIREFLKKHEDLIGALEADWVDPEHVWVRAHGNIHEFCATLPLAQSMQIKGEDLLSQPELYLPQIAEWLGLRTDEEAVQAMLHPESSPYACFGPESAQFGNDPNFLERPAYREGEVREPSLAGTLEWAPGSEFSRTTLKLAREFGYS